MPLELTVVDAFTTVPFAGNPAAVAVVEVFPDGPQMQAIAAEVNLSETAFVVDRSDGEHDLRWFTPTTEVDLCGHATLASAHVLGRSVRFHTKSGILHCEVNDDRIEMDFPAQPIEKAERPVQLDFPGVRWYGVGDFFAFVELEDAAVLRTLEPDLQMVASLGTRALDSDRGRRPTRRRLRQPSLRPERRNPRGPGNGLGSLCLGAVLGGPARA